MRVLLRVLLIAYLLVVVLLAFLQRRLMYFPATADRLPVAAFGGLKTLYPAAEDVRIRCDDAVEIGGWLLTKEPVDHAADPAGRPLVLFFHGNAGNRAGRQFWYQLLSDCGVDILAIDYHGYGESQGTPTQAALYSDADATWSYAVDTLRYKPSQILVMGVSLGSAPAVHLASARSAAGKPPAGLVTVAAFSSMVNVAASHYPWLPVRAVLADRYPSDEKIKLVTCPLLQFHGDRDTVVDQKFGKQLFAAAPDASRSKVPKRWIELRRTGHNDLIANSGRTIQAELADFVLRVTAR
ncbi:MAG: alpha/beta hydrolase [Planctomycetaceae bacterium]